MQYEENLLKPVLLIGDRATTCKQLIVFYFSVFIRMKDIENSLLE